MQNVRKEHFYKLSKAGQNFDFFSKMDALLSLKNPFYPTIFLELEGEKIDHWYYHEEKCKKVHFKLGHTRGLTIIFARNKLGDARSNLVRVSVLLI